MSGETRPLPTAPASGRARLTGRGCVVLMLLIFLVSDLLADKLGWGWLGGAGYGLGFLLAVTYARRESLLLVVIAPPVLFLVALITAELVTATGSTLLATAEGTLLALATCAPWLFGITVVALVAAMVRGLPQSVRDFKAELSGLSARPGNETPAGPGAGLTPAAPRQPTQTTARPPS